MTHSCVAAAFAATTARRAATSPPDLTQSPRMSSDTTSLLPSPQKPPICGTNCNQNQLCSLVQPVQLLDPSPPARIAPTRAACCWQPVRMPQARGMGHQTPPSAAERLRTGRPRCLTSSRSDPAAAIPSGRTAPQKICALCLRPQRHGYLRVLQVSRAYAAALARQRNISAGGFRPENCRCLRRGNGCSARSRGHAHLGPGVRPWG